MNRLRSFLLHATAAALLAAAHAVPAQEVSTAETAPDRTLRAHLGILRPLVFEDESGALAGLEYELLRDFASAEGIRLETSRASGVDDKLNALLEGRADIAVGAIDITPDRARQVLFTRATVVSGKAILVRKDADHGIRSHWNLRGRKVATKAATTSVPLLQELGATPVPFPTIHEAVQSLERRETDAVVFDAPVLWDISGSGKHPDLTVSGDVFNPVGYGIAVSPGNETLRDEINRFLTDYLQSARYQELLRHHHVLPPGDTGR